MKYLLIISCSILFSSCKKDRSISYDSNIVNNWKAIQWQNDIGNGSTPFSDIPADKNYFFNFRSDGSFAGDYLFTGNEYDKYRIVDSTKINLYKNNYQDSLRIFYAFSNNYQELIISFHCIEACRVKLIRN